MKQDNWLTDQAEEDEESMEPPIIFGAYEYERWREDWDIDD